MIRLKNKPRYCISIYGPHIESNKQIAVTGLMIHYTNKYPYNVKLIT